MRVLLKGYGVYHTDGGQERPALYGERADVKLTSFL